jgi:hypothetical protein
MQQCVACTVPQAFLPVHTAVLVPVVLPCRAERVFERQVLPVLQDAAGMSVSSMVTSGPGAATELLSQLDLTAVDLLLFVGGDGTVYEGLQVSSHNTVQCLWRVCVCTGPHRVLVSPAPALPVARVWFMLLPSLCYHLV